MKNIQVPILVATALALVCQTVSATELHVSPSGRDSNPGTKERPFATIEKARDAVRRINQDMKGDIVVVLRGGIYRLDHTLVFEPQDSGSGGHNVIYKPANGETPILSGGKPVVRWKQDGAGRWKAAAPTANFRQLYVNGARATRARGEAPAGLQLVGDDGYTTTAVKMADWKNPADLEFCYQIAWTHVRCKAQSIKHDGDRAMITMLQPHFTYAKTHKGGVNVGIFDPKHDLLYLENALELLDEPGEWYLDKPTKTVHYLPRPGEDMEKAEVIAPALERLVELRGTLQRPVSNIHFVGIRFEHGSWLEPSREGFADVQANFFVDCGRTTAGENVGVDFSKEYFIKSPANVVGRAVKAIRFERCTFTKLGAGGLDLEYGAQDNTVSGCRFFDISGTAVQIGDVLKDDHHPDDPRKIVKNNSVVNCYIHDCGVDYWGSVGVFAGYTEGTVIAHNEITRLPYSGVSIGWGWGLVDAGGGNPNYKQPVRFDTPTPAKNNRIEFNHIHRVMQRADDGGAIYTLGNMPGSVIRGNHIHHDKKPGRIRGWGGDIYLDEGSGFIEVTGNLVYESPKPLNLNNKAQNRNATCNFHDNWFDVNPNGPAAFPAETQEVIDQAGLTPEYRDLLGR